MNLQEVESKSLIFFEKHLQPLTCPYVKEGNNEVPTQKSNYKKQKHKGARVRVWRSKNKSSKEQNKSTKEQKSKGAWVGAPSKVFAF